MACPQMFQFLQVTNTITDLIEVHLSFIEIHVNSHTSCIRKSCKIVLPLIRFAASCQAAVYVSSFRHCCQNLKTHRYYLGGFYVIQKPSGFFALFRIPHRAHYLLNYIVTFRTVLTIIYFLLSMTSDVKLLQSQSAEKYKLKLQWPIANHTTELKTQVQSACSVLCTLQLWQQITECQLTQICMTPAPSLANLAQRWYKYILQQWDTLSSPLSGVYTSIMYTQRSLVHVHLCNQSINQSINRAGMGKVLMHTQTLESTQLVVRLPYLVNVHPMLRSGTKTIIYFALSSVVQTSRRTRARVA